MIWTPPDRWNPLHITHCGVNPALFTPKRHESKGNRLIFVGRLAAVKGVPVLLEAVARLRETHPDIELVLAGDGPDRDWLQRKAADKLCHVLVSAR